MVGGPKTETQHGLKLNAQAFREGGKLLLSHQDARVLLAYCWFAIMLPTDEAALKAQMAMPKDKEFEHGLKVPIQNLLGFYKEAKEHCTAFKDVTYPAIIDIAGGIRSYAKNASMRGDKSYYQVILENFIKLITEMDKDLDKQDKKLIDNLKAIIRSTIDTEQRGVEAQKTKVEEILKAMQGFEMECRGDKGHFEMIKEQIDKELMGASGLISDYETKIKEMNRKKDKLNEKYRKDCILAGTSPLYSIVWPIGLIVTVAMSGVYGKEAADLRKEVGDLIMQIQENEDNKKSAGYLVQEGGMVENQLQGIVDQVKAAISVLAAMQSAWDSVRCDLVSLRESLEEISYKPTVEELKDSLGWILDDWQKLYDQADEFIKNARMTEPETMSIDHWMAIIIGGSHEQRRNA